MKNLPIELTDEYQANVRSIDANTPSQSMEEIMSILQEARKPGDVQRSDIGGLVDGSTELDDMDDDLELDEDVDTSGDFVCAL